MSKDTLIEKLQALDVDKEGGEAYDAGFYDCQNQAIAIVRQHTGWMDISSAPKDVRYLGIIEYAPGKYGEPFVCEWDEDEGHVCQFKTEAVSHKPTHWMPLPPQPELPKQD